MYGIFRCSCIVWQSPLCVSECKLLKLIILEHDDQNQEEEEKNVHKGGWDIFMKPKINIRKPILDRLFMKFNFHDLDWSM